jgi:hypothetical protein
MGKQNEKKMIRAARDTLVVGIGNLLESERQRKFAYRSRPGPKTRRTFCNKFKLAESTVTWLETGRVLNLGFALLRPYLAALRGKDDTKLLESFKKVYDGLKELGPLLKRL